MLSCVRVGLVCAIPLQVRFLGEDGVDAGGPSREFWRQKHYRSTLLGSLELASSVPALQVYAYLSVCMCMCVVSKFWLLSMQSRSRPISGARQVLYSPPTFGGCENAFLNPHASMPC